MIKKLLNPRLAVLLLTLNFGNFAAAQTGCGWFIKADVIQTTCNGSCNGSVTVIPDDPTALYTYSWSNGATTNAIYNLCDGSYTVTMTDEKGCSATETYTIVDPAAVMASCAVLNDESAPGAADGSIEASATGGVLPYTYEWQTNPVVYGSVLSGLSAGNYYVIVYDANDCAASSYCTITTKKKEKCEGFRTQTQGGWGQCQQNGNNPGSYLFNNFAGAFPAGLTIGCTRTLKLTSAQAVCDFLPSGTSPKVLPVGQVLNPGTSYKNVFAGQLVTAVINVQFDLYDPNFGSSNTHLGDLIIANGTFMNWTVNQLIDEANKKIGGCASPYSASALSGALDAINNNYDDGNVDKGFLLCPELKKKDGRISTTDVHMSIFPNPVSEKSVMMLSSVKDDVLNVELFSITGQKVSTLYSGTIAAGNRVAVEIDAANLESGVYFIQVRTANGVMTEKIMVRK